MNPATHFLAGWGAANCLSLTPRGRLAVTLAAVIPDLDGFGALPDLLGMASGSEGAVMFSAWHHTFGHGLLFGVAASACLAFLAFRGVSHTRVSQPHHEAIGQSHCEAIGQSHREAGKQDQGEASGQWQCETGSFARLKLFVACLMAFHLHLLMDLAGARGPDGYTWPIPYLYPFAGPLLEWSGQWELNGWPNFAITAVLLATTFRIAWKSGVTPLELFFPEAESRVVKTLRNRFGEPGNPSNMAIRTAGGQDTEA